MIKPFITYLKNPKYVYSPVSLNFPRSVAFIGISLWVYLIFIVISSIFVILPIYLLDLIPTKITKVYPLTFNILILVPLYEELIFRLPLRFSYRNLFIAIATLVVLLMNRSFNLYISLGSGLLIAYIPFTKILHTDILNKIQKYYFKYYKAIFYTLTLTFGLGHLFNFNDLNFAHFLISPLILINQVFMGFLLSYARVNYKYGLLYCFIIHAFINFIFLAAKNLF